MPISEFNPVTVGQIQEEIQSALDTIAAKHGLRPVLLEEVKSNHYKLTFSASMVTDMDVNRDLLIVTASKFGLGSDFIDSVLVIKNKRFKVIDFVTGIYPVVLEEIETRDQYKVSPKQLLSPSVVKEAMEVTS